MSQIYLKYNPYRLETIIQVNGRNLEQDHDLFKLLQGKRLQEWIVNFPAMLVESLTTREFDVEFHGMELDYDDVKESFEHAAEQEIIRNFHLKWREAKNSDTDVHAAIEGIFGDLTGGPHQEFKDEGLLNAFNDINNTVFPINVIATMSSGKSTLINALLAHKLMPSKNEACTATITEILDNDGKGFSAKAYDENDELIETVHELTYREMARLNENEKVNKIEAQGNIPFLDCRKTALKLIDTPGPNNSQNDSHQATMRRAIKGNVDNLILYVLNGTQLSTKDDQSLLDEVSKEMAKGGKQVRDRFLFVINKMDGFDPEEEDIGRAVAAAKRYLEQFKIKDPQIFPCSAFTALNIRQYLRGVNIEKMTREEERKLPAAARDTIPMIYKFIDHESMHLEQYSTLSPSEQRKIKDRLDQVTQSGDLIEQALIHCGIYSIEAAITAYVKKYAATRKIKNLVESFQGVLESSKVLASAKVQVATSKEAAEECERLIAVVREKLSTGKEAEAFEQKINALDPMTPITDTAKKLQKEAADTMVSLFENEKSIIEDQSIAKRLVDKFAEKSKQVSLNLSLELESTINRELIDAGTNALKEYQDKLKQIDKSAYNNEDKKHLNFDTDKLIKGPIDSMRMSMEKWVTSDDFSTTTVSKVGKVITENVEEQTIEQREVERAVGGEWVTVCKELVKVGSHQEFVGTKKVKNPKKKWFKFFTPKYIEKDVYETVDDYEERDVTEWKITYEKFLEPYLVTKTRQVQKFHLETAQLQADLMSELRRNLDKGIKGTLKGAQEQTDEMKKQFEIIFNDLDKLIQEKYNELKKCVEDKENAEAELEKNKRDLEWLETNIEEINSILEM